MKKILITGGDGQLSKQLFLELSNNFEVISLNVVTSIYPKANKTLKQKN